MAGLHFYFYLFFLESYSVLETWTLPKISIVETLLSLCGNGLWV